MKRKYIVLIALTFSITWFLAVLLFNSAKFNASQEKNAFLELEKANHFISQAQKVVKQLNDVLLKANKIGDLIQEKYADINDTKDAQRINEYLELRDCLGQASAELRKAIAILPEALKTPLDTANLLPVEQHLKMAELILKYIEMRLSD